MNEPTLTPPTGAAFNRGQSKQDYATPKEFIDAVEKRFGKIGFDLAASASNAKAPRYFSETENSLAQDWRKIEADDYGSRLLFLNPPFGNIAPWSEKCALSLRERPE